MITLLRDTLTFTFPEIAEEVRALAQRKIKEVAAELPPTWDRDELVSQIESAWCFDELSQEAQERARTRMRTWTPANVEGMLEEFALNRAGVGRDSLTALDVKFQRTMRIPDDGKTYALPIGLGQLPIRSVDDFPETAPGSWLKQGGVILPLARSEALWIWFSSTYHFAVKIDLGNVDALSRKPSRSGLQREPQNYLTVPASFKEGSEVVRRLVTMPLDRMNMPSKEVLETSNGDSIQLQVIPMFGHCHFENEAAFGIAPTIRHFFDRLFFAPIVSKQLEERERWRSQLPFQRPPIDESTRTTLDETMRGEIPEDLYEPAEWDQSESVHCFVHVCNPLMWQQITGTGPPYSPLTASEYREAGIPWFDDYADDLCLGNTAAAAGQLAESRMTRRHSEIREYGESRIGD